MQQIYTTVLLSLYEYPERDSKLFNKNRLKTNYQLTIFTQSQKEYKRKLQLFFITSLFYLSCVVRPNFSNLILSTGKGRKEEIHKTFLKLKIFSYQKGSFFNFDFIRVLSLLKLLKTNFSMRELKYFIKKTCILNNNLFFEMRKLINLSPTVLSKTGKRAAQCTIVKYKVTDLNPTQIKTLLI